MRLRQLTIVAVALLGVLGIGLQSHAAVLNVTATFREQTPTNSSNTADNGGTDLWSVIVSGPAVPGFYVQSFTVTLPSSPGDLRYNTVTGGTNVGWPFARISGPMESASSVVDGQDVLAVSFAAGEFEAGETFSYGIDVDNGNLAVRGFHPDNTNGAIGGNNTSASTVTNPTTRRAKLDITYWNGIELATATAYFHGTGVLDDGTAQADVQILAGLPEPASMAIWGLGAAAFGAGGLWRRKRVAV